MTFNVLQKTAFGQSEVLLPRTTVQFSTARDQLVLTECLRTVFAVVIDDLWVIIEDLEDQQSYFRVIDSSF